MKVKDALLLVLDQVDYTQDACTMTEMVGAVLPLEVIKLAREAIKEDDETESTARQV